jgi:uncharacterized protein (DUF2384 family)
MGSATFRRRKVVCLQRNYVCRQTSQSHVYPVSYLERLHSAKTTQIMKVAGIRASSRQRRFSASDNET